MAWYLLAWSRQESVEVVICENRVLVNRFHHGYSHSSHLDTSCGAGPSA